MLHYMHAIECVLSAIAHVHAHPAVHGDIKPDNLLVSHYGTVVLADFDFQGHACPSSRLPTRVSLREECGRLVIGDAIM